MNGFARSLTTTLVPLLAVGSVLALVASGDGSPQTGQAQVAQQTEDDLADQEATGEPGTVDEAGLPLFLLPDGAVDLVADGTATQQVFLTRDPFQPVVPTDDGTTPDGSGDGSTTDGGTSDGGTTDGGTSDGGTTDGGTTDDDACDGSEAETVCDGRVVTLEAVDDDTATVTVDGTSFDVMVDDDFAGSFRVLAIDPPCATLLYGDESFAICTGVTVLK